MQTMSDVQQLAAEAYACFEQAKRSDGSEFTRVKEGSPEWVTDLVYKAHGGDFLPDDWRYETIRSALAYIGDDATDPEDEAGEFADTQVSVYTSERIEWLGSNLNRASYCDEAAAEYGEDVATDVIGMIGLGQYAEAREIYELTLSALQSLAD